MNIMSTNDTTVPLCVDLDGTLVKSDLLIESVFALLKKKLRYAILLPLWLLKGKAALKHEIATHADIDISLLPYHEELGIFLQEEKKKGRPLYLVTATNKKYADQVAALTGIFDGVIASDAENNLSGSGKLRAIQDFFKSSQFDYAGNEKKDLKIWGHARKAIIVSDNSNLIAETKKIAEVECVFDSGQKTNQHLKAMRPHQWVKNLLVFLPLFAAQEITNASLDLQAIAAFIAFSFCASSVYLLNDLLDLPVDRKHPRKRLRPYASGTASIVHGAALIPILLLLSLLVALFLPIEFLIVLIIYYLCTLFYSIKLKNVVMLDVLLLAGLYTLRIIAGAAAVSIEPSFWILAFSLFIFLSLAMVKRYSELQYVVKSGQKKIAGRGYQTTDLELLISLGSSSGYMAVLVLALYINSPEVIGMYTHPEIIWLLCPLLLYWISRIWFVTKRGEMHDDPVVFALRDKISRIVVIIAFAILISAQYF